MGKFWRGSLRVLMGVGLVCFFGVSSPASGPSPSEWNLETITRAYPTPESIAEFLRNQISFAEDRDLFGRSEYWQAPEEFLARRKGDCEDYAILTQALLKRLGFEAFVFSLYGERGYAHTVMVFKENGRYHVVNQDRLIRLQAKSLEELSDRLYSDWTWGAVVAQRGHQGRIICEIFKTPIETQPS